MIRWIGRHGWAVTAGLLVATLASCKSGGGGGGGY
jgi:hypothetical protein